MPKPPKAYKERGWFITRAGRYTKLCRVSEGIAVARARLREHVKQLEQEREQSGGRIFAPLTVKEVFAEFLSSVEAEKSASTFDGYRRWCQRFAERHGNRRASDVSRLDAQRFKQELITSKWVRNKQAPRPYKPKAINNALIALRRAFNWAIDQGLILEGRNPFAKIKLLSWQGRQRTATEHEFLALLDHCRDAAFRDVLIALRYTSARPGDIRGLSWPMVQWQLHRWWIPDHKTTKTAKDPRPRIIGMNDLVEGMLRERAAKYGMTGRVFLNSKGKPWTSNALGLRLRRLRARAGIRADERGEEFVLYTYRHSFLSSAATDPTISESMLKDIAGHTDSRTTGRYIHLASKTVSDAGRRVADALASQDTSAGK